MYTCNKCKQNYDGQPARMTGKNYRLKFCQACSDDVYKKSLLARQARNAKIAEQNQCLFCGDALTDANRSVSRKAPTSNMCVDCDSKSPQRTWLLKCVEHSNAILKYIDTPSRRRKWEQTRTDKELARKQKAETLPLLDAPKVEASTISRELFDEFIAFMAQKKGSR